MKKKIFIPASIIVLCLLCLFLFPIKWKIDRECKAYLLSTGNTAKTEELSIRIKGEYTFRLFSSDAFQGTFEVEGFPETQDDVTLTFDHGIANMIYYRWDKLERHSVCFGILSADFNLKNFVILKGDTIDLSGNTIDAIVSERMDVSDADAVRIKLLEQK